MARTDSNKLIEQKFEEWNHYQILDISPKADIKEIEKAYHLGKYTYRENSLAPYGLISDEARQFMLNRIEEAYRILSDPQKRETYDEALFSKNKSYQPKASFRKTTQKLFIEEAPEPTQIWNQIKSLLKRKEKKASLT